MAAKRESSKSRHLSCAFSFAVEREELVLHILEQCFSNVGTRNPVGTRAVAWWHAKKFKFFFSITKFQKR
jgi:hypothetical protein